MKLINVTKTYLPPMEEYQEILSRAWDKRWLTNRGVLVRELEEKLKSYLGVNYLTLTTNGTLPIQIAIKALGLKGEIITTPFSYVATTSSIVWEGCKPVFVDIHPEYLTIDETKIEKLITNKTTAILATHVFGNPCNVEALDRIAKKYNIKVIYDAAHCFGVEYKGQSILNYGDVSTCSFHATKIFHTGEGGCWVTNNNDLQDKLYYRHNFGHSGPGVFLGVGINAKMSELQGAMGLAVFNYLDEIFSGRERVVNTYDKLLIDFPLQKIKIRPDTKWNYHYYPIIFESEEVLLRVQSALNAENINPRRYFYPCLSTLNYVGDFSVPISKGISPRIMCLPIYPDLETESVETICNIIRSNL